METKLKLAVCQLRTELDQDETMEKAARMVREAAQNGAEIVALPEMFNCPYSREYFLRCAGRGHEAAVAAMSGWARENGVLLVGGSIPELEDGKLYNTCFVFDEQGRRLARHRKLHLFDVDLPGMRFLESATFSPGEEITTFETRWGTMGAAICFDIRFPELFRAMASRGAQIIFLPAQFNRTTGPAHWELSLRARAVDNELFVVGASAARYEGFAYESWGHSAVVDPFGVLLASCGDGETILYADADLARIAEVRRRLPTFLHLREEIYEVAR